MIFRILLLFLVIWGLFWLLKKQLADKPASPSATEDDAEDMLACEHCGVHVPKSLSVQVDGKAYCCHEHSPAARQHRGDDG